MRTPSLALLAIASLAVGCAGPLDEPHGGAYEDSPRAPADAPPTPAFADKIKGGTVTNERPEVGVFGGCTATLVASDVLITAAHCVNYASSDYSQHTFRIDGLDGRAHIYGVERYRSLDQRLGDNDIAIVRLAEPVPESVAKPVPIASDQPADGESLTVYGYGCTDWGRSPDGQKRKASFAMGGPSDTLCPGDSGGPVFDDQRNAVLRINSGQWNQSRDIFGIVPPNYSRIREQIAAWTRGPIPEIGDAEPRPPAEMCGTTRDVFVHWTCTGSGGHKYQCPRGGLPEWIACANGCRPGPVGHHAACGEEIGLRGEGPRRRCGETWAPYTDWACARDGLTLVRCVDDELWVNRCDTGCDWEPGPDACR